MVAAGSGLGDADATNSFATGSGDTMGVVERITSGSGGTVAATGVAE